MIYIHGINHNMQHKGTGSDPEGASRLEKLVESLCVEKDITVVAEEFSTEACEYNGVEASICHQTARRMQLQPIYCDPVSSERARLGIPSQAELVERAKKDLGVTTIMGKKSNDYYNQLAAKYHSIRETFWLTQETTGSHRKQRGRVLNIEHIQDSRHDPLCPHLCPHLFS